MSQEIDDRLVKGAGILGKLWRQGVRCALKFSFQCQCETKSVFCRAKDQWVKLYAQAVVDGRDAGMPEDGEYAIVESMTPMEFDISGLTMTVLVPELGEVKIGPKGSIPWDVFKKLTREDMTTVLAVVREFPGSKVVNKEE